MSNDANLYLLFLNIGVRPFGNLVVDKYAAAMLAHDDFLVHLDFALTLGRYLAEAAATSVAVDSYHSKTIAGLLTNTLVASQVTLVDELLHLFRLVQQAHLVFHGLLDNTVQLSFL